MIDNLNTLKQAGELLHSKDWQRPLAKDLGVNDRTVRRWVSRDSQVKDGVIADLKIILQSKIDNMQKMLDSFDG